MPTRERVNELLCKYAEGPERLEAAVRGIPSDEMNFSPGPGHWSIHENVVHVADVELVGVVRMRYVLAEPGATLVAFDQERWGTALGYAAWSSASALTLFRAVRETTVDLLRRAPVEAWTQTGMHVEAGPQSLEWLVEHFADHVPYHLRTIAKRRSQYQAARAAR
jgi:hypothetical protein